MNKGTSSSSAMPLLGSAAIASAIKSGNVNIAGTMKTEVLDLSEESQKAMLEHAETLRKFEAQQRARSISVPTSVEDVKRMLREMGHPVTLFGESPADRRERLKENIASMELSVEEVSKTQKMINDISKHGGSSTVSSSTHVEIKASSGPQKEVFYSPANEYLITARRAICDYSCEKSLDRISNTKRIRASEELQANEDRIAAALYINSKDLALSASQFADDRPLTSVRFSPSGDILATGSFSGMVKLWDFGSLRSMTLAGVFLRGHEERITGLAWHPQAFKSIDTPAVLATTSADGSCILWDCRKASLESELSAIPSRASTGDNRSEQRMDVEGGGDEDGKDEDEAMDVTPGNEGSSQSYGSSNGHDAANPYILHKLKGHVGPVSECDFHSSGKYLGTAGQDYSWRLWDVETGQELLLQDGHIKECSTITFQADGALVMTGDWAGVALLWDLRSGQAIHAFQGHIKKIVTSAFSPNSVQVATAGADNMVRIWDLRKKKCGYALPAHSNLISDVRYSSSGELLLTSSFDGTVKMWNSRDYEPLRTLQGHVGKVMSCDIAPDERHVASAGYDRTMKKWAHRLEM